MYTTKDNSSWILTCILLWEYNWLSLMLLLLKQACNLPSVNQNSQDHFLMFILTPSWKCLLKNVVKTQVKKTTNKKTREKKKPLHCDAVAKDVKSWWSYTNWLYCRTRKSRLFQWPDHLAALVRQARHKSNPLLSWLTPCLQSPSKSPWTNTQWARSRWVTRSKVRLGSISY